MSDSSDPSVALSLSSSYLGYVTHAGFVAGLEEGGVVPGHLAGSSAGALVGGLVTAGLSSSDIRSLLLHPGFRSRWFDWAMPLRLLPTILHYPGQTGMLSGRNMLRHLENLIARSPRPSGSTGPRLSIAVTNLSTGRSEWKEDGNVAQWIIASCAVPGLFRHQRIEDEDYIDGGIADPYPCAAWTDLSEVSTVILHRIVHPGQRRSSAWNLSRALCQGHESVSRGLLDAQVRLLRNSGKQVHVAETETPRPSILTGRHKNKTMWELGRRNGIGIAAKLSGSLREQTSCAPKTP